MFGFFKKKLKEAIGSVSKKVSKEEREKEKALEVTKELKVKAPSAAPKRPAPIAKIKAAIVEKELTEDYLGEVLGELELALIEANVAAQTAEKIIADIKAKLVGKSVKRSEAEKIIRDTVQEDVAQILGQKPLDILATIKKAKAEGRPAVIMFMGFNGTGKSLSVARVAAWLKKQGHKPILAAGDTFRAAGIEQLEEYAKGVGVEVVKQKQGSDSAAVIFDAIKAARARGFDVVLADTAGRAHTDKNLIDEMRKIIRVNKPDLKLLVCEAVAGSDVVNQARAFNDAAAEFGGLDGFVLTKWDVDEKGGAAISLCHALRKPIVFLGIGQRFGDLELFDVETALRGIFGA